MIGQYCNSDSIVSVRKENFIYCFVKKYLMRRLEEQVRYSKVFYSFYTLM